MADPRTPAPMEDVALEYIKTAMEELGIYKPVNTFMDNAAQTYFLGIYRGLWHFLTITCL